MSPLSDPQRHRPRGLPPLRSGCSLSARRNGGRHRDDAEADCRNRCHASKHKRGVAAGDLVARTRETPGS